MMKVWILFAWIATLVQGFVVLPPRVIPKTVLLADAVSDYDMDDFDGTFKHCARRRRLCCHE